MAASMAVFDAIAERYDSIFTESVIGRAQRQAVWRELEPMLAPGQRVLEINCGTGTDAMFMARRGVEVDACDVSPRMIAVAKRRLQPTIPSIGPRFFVQPIEQLHRVAGTYDGVLSNFGGLNCVRDIDEVARELGRLVRPGGFLVICLAGRFCAWELAWYAVHGQFAKATRRLGGDVDGGFGDRTVRVYYRTVPALARAFGPQFRLLRRRGVGVLVPPTYAESWAVRHRRAIAAAARLDIALSSLPLVRAVADHVLLVMERKRT